MTSVYSNKLNLKYQKLTLSGCKDIGIRNWDLWQRLNPFDEVLQIYMVN